MRRRAALGFTLIELMVTVAVLSVLALGAVPLAELVVKRGKEQQLRAALREIRTAIDAYKKAVDDNRIARPADANGYPASLEVLVDGVIDAKDPGKRRIYFLRRLPREPMASQPGETPAAGWGLRSYESSAEAPQAGKDVFDVYSRSEEVGLNGVPYREW